MLLEEDYKRKWQDDPEGAAIFLEARKKAGDHPVFPCYAVSDAVAHTIVDITATMGASHLILGAPGATALPTFCAAISCRTSPTICRRIFTSSCMPRIALCGASAVRWHWMRTVVPLLFGLFCLVLPLAAAPNPAPATTTNSISWRAKQNQVDAEIQRWDLSKLLRKIASATGWKVYVEPGTTEQVSVKFKNLAEDEALRRLLGKVNYARDETNGVTRLFVFQTASKAATEMVPAEKKDYRIPNELLVKLKHNPTNSMDQLAKQLGAKIISRG